MKEKLSQNKTVLFILSDIIILNVAFAFAILLFYRTNFLLVISLKTLKAMAIINLVFVISFFCCSIYKVIWRYIGVEEFLKIIKAFIIALPTIYGFHFVLKTRFSVQIYIVGAMAAVLLFFLSRILYLRSIDLRLNIENSKRRKKKIMIVGAGAMGEIMIKEMINERYRFGVPLVVVDDDFSKKGKKLRGVTILSPCEKIPEYVRVFNIDEIILCIPSASIEQKKRVVKILLSTNCTIKQSPSIHAVRVSDFTMDQIQNVCIEELLQREQIKFKSELCDYIKNETILITGGGGSIGSQICTVISKYSPKEIIIFDIYENNAFELVNEIKLKNLYQGKIHIRIGSVSDLARLEEVFCEFLPNLVFHAAAHKHVPLMEQSPAQAVKTNVVGTLNTAICCEKYEVKRAILLSSDKAVNPTNVMGATKRVAELVFQTFNQKQGKTIFAAVRFGNVLGSNGSVIPLFKKQIASGGPVKVTHKDITRFFMTIPEAAQLVIIAGGRALGGEIYVLDMGESVKIFDLANNLIRLSGFVPEKDIKIEITKLRPGEKLFEELYLKEEHISTIDVDCNKKIFVTKPIQYNDCDAQTFNDMLQSVIELSKFSPNEVRGELKKIVKNYKD